MGFNKILFHDLFSVVVRFVWESGGDGDGWIVSSRYKELANLFGDYQKQNGNYFHFRMDGDGVVVFQNGDRGQESISFVKERNEPSPIGDIVVRSIWFE